MNYGKRRVIFFYIITPPASPYFKGREGEIFFAEDVLTTPLANFRSGMV
jgi:hypothetical protein